MPFGAPLLHPGLEESRANYRSEVRAVDRAIGRLRQIVQEIGASENTLWVVTSDHGEGLRHHDSMGHADEVFEDQLRIAWILAGPGIPAGRRIDRAAVNHSVLPTLLELLDVPPSRELVERSLARCLQEAGCGRTEPAPWWSYCVPPRVAQPLPIAGYHWPYKLVDEGSTLPLVFDLEADPWETTPLDLETLRSNREVVALLRSLDDRREHWLGLVRPEAEPAIDPEREEALRALGYLDD